MLSEWLGTDFLRQYVIAYILVNAAHILSVGILLGSIVLLDLRILGVAGRWPLEVMGKPLSYSAASGVACAMVTGGLLFSVRPGDYLANPAFAIKMVLLGFMIINAILLRNTSQWRVACMSGQSNIVLRIQAAISLIGWSGVLLAGRWVGFV